MVYSPCVNWVIVNCNELLREEGYKEAEPHIYKAKANDHLHVHFFQFNFNFEIQGAKVYSLHSPHSLHINLHTYYTNNYNVISFLRQFQLI